MSPPRAERLDGPPRSVMIELTNECQLACITCPRDKKDAHDYELGRMSFATFQRIFGLFEDRLETLDLTGLGESLMHPEIFDIIRWVRQRRKVHIYLTTNTILLTASNIARLAADPVDTLCISVDGVSDEQLEAVRGIALGPLKRKVAAAVSALQPRTELILCTVLVHENLADMPRFVELAAELGIGRISLKPINLVGNDLPASYYDAFRTPAFAALADEARLIGQRRGVDVAVFDIGRYSCSFPWDPMYVTWNGHVVPCCAKPFPKRLSFGDLGRQPLDAVLNSDAAVAFRREMAAGRPPSFCDKCHIMEETLYREALVPLRLPVRAASGPC